MKLRGIIWMVLLTTFMISACDNSTGTEMKDPEPKENSESAVDDQFKELSNEEAMSIIKDLIASIDTDMLHLQIEHDEWALTPWIDDPDADRDSYDAAHSVTRNVLSTHFTKTQLN